VEENISPSDSVELEDVESPKEVEEAGIHLRQCHWPTSHSVDADVCGPTSGMVVQQDMWSWILSGNHREMKRVQKGFKPFSKREGCGLRNPWNVQSDS
jgi:hypothetical protein